MKSHFRTNRSLKKLSSFRFTIHFPNGQIYTQKTIKRIRNKSNTRITNPYRTTTSTMNIEEANKAKELNVSIIKTLIPIDGQERRDYF